MTFSATSLVNAVIPANAGIQGRERGAGEERNDGLNNARML
jgi:hypothetical protein